MKCENSGRWKMESDGNKGERKRIKGKKDRNEKIKKGKGIKIGIK